MSLADNISFRISDRLDQLEKKITDARRNLAVFKLAPPEQIGLSDSQKDAFAQLQETSKVIAEIALGIDTSLARFSEVI